MSLKENLKYKILGNMKEDLTSLLEYVNECIETDEVLDEECVYGVTSKLNSDMDLLQCIYEDKEQGNTYLEAPSDLSPFTLYGRPNSTGNAPPSDKVHVGDPIPTEKWPEGNTKPTFEEALKGAQEWLAGMPHSDEELSKVRRRTIGVLDVLR